MRYKKECICAVLCISMLLGLVGCSQRMIPEEGVWFCEELNMVIDFDDVTKCEYMGRAGYEIGYERTGNFFYIISHDPYREVFKGLIVQKTDEYFIAKQRGSSKTYKFERR